VRLRKLFGRRCLLMLLESAQLANEFAFLVEEINLVGGLVADREPFLESTAKRSG